MRGLIRVKATCVLIEDIMHSVSYLKPEQTDRKQYRATKFTESISLKINVAYWYFHKTTVVPLAMIIIIL